MKKILMLFLGFFGAVLLNAADLAESELAKKAGFDTITADFEQIVKNDDAIIKYSGFLAIDTAKNLAFWRYDEPAKKLIYISPNEILSIEPDLEQVILSPAHDLPALNKLIKSARQSGPNELIAVFEETEYSIILDENFTPKTIQYNDKFANLTTINIKNAQKNAPLPAGIFKPQIPAHYDIVKN